MDCVGFVGRGMLMNVQLVTIHASCTRAMPLMYSANTTTLSMRKFIDPLSFPTQSLFLMYSLFFCGDYNDRYHPRRMLQPAGYWDTFSRLSLPLHRTWPTPSWGWVEDATGVSDFACDFIFSCDRVKPLTSQVVEHSLRGVHPSDHFPVVAVFQLK